MDKIVLAVDLGGTNLRMAAVGAGGEVVARSKSATPRSDDPRDIVEAIIASARDCHDPGAPEYDIQAIGIAIPAMSIGAGGIVNKAANLPSLDGFALAPAVAEKLGVPAVLENDANAAAIGENWIGASRGIRNSICVTLGTGVGGGIILNGSTLRGPDWSAGEIGHICVEPLGPPCGCGSNGCVEQYSSATAIVRMAREIMGNYPASELHGKFELSAFDVYEAGKSGDELAAEVFRLMGQYLGIALAGPYKRIESRGDRDRRRRGRGMGPVYRARPGRDRKKGILRARKTRETCQSASRRRCRYPRSGARSFWQRKINPCCSWSVVRE